MQYIQVDDDKFISYDSETQNTSIISKGEIESRISELETTIPKVPSDADLLKWAKTNYPGIDVITAQQKEISDKQDILDSLTTQAIDVSAEIKPVVIKK
jgi:hypothetical protein